MSDDTRFSSATLLARRIRRGDLTALGLIEAHLERIEEHDTTTNAYVRVLAADAREAARAADAAIEAGNEGGPFHGVPVAVKDNTAVAGVPLTFGAKPLANDVAERSDVPVERLEGAGAVVLGKTNTPEFGHRSTTDNPLFGPTGTPFDPAKTAGGSSGGSAAAVADGLAAIAQGTDGGGSLRIPASACGVYGHKPSFGLVPTRSRPDGFGHTPFVESGPLSRTVADAAAFLDVVAGPHPDDPFSRPRSNGDYRTAVDRGIDDLTVAHSPDLGLFPIDDRVTSVVREAVAALAEAGATVVEADPSFAHSRATMREAWQRGFDVSLATTRANVRERTGIDLLDRREELSGLVAEHIERGGAYSAVEYKRADAVRTAAFDAVQTLFGEVDLLVCPTLAVPPFDVRSVGPGTVDGESVDPVFGWCLTWPFNMTGHPAASVPAGLADGLPVGLQIVGPRFRDDLVLAASAALERVRPWQHTYPPRGRD